MWSLVVSVSESAGKRSIFRCPLVPWRLFRLVSLPSLGQYIILSLSRSDVPSELKIVIFRLETAIKFYACNSSMSDS